MSKKQCKLCLNYFDQLSKSHIIPKWAFASISTDLRSISRNDHVRRAPMGTYDTNILCYQCEKVFGPFDSYAAEVLKPKPYNDPEGLCNTSIYVSDPSLLTIFFLSVLWRAHVSTMPEFNQVNLGIKHSQNIKSIILYPDTLKSTDYPTILAQINWDLGGRGIISPPMRREINTLQGKLNGYTLWVGDVIAYVLIDSRMRSIHSPLFTDSLAPTIPLPQIDLSKTLEIKALIDLMRSTKRPFLEYVKT